MDIKKKLPEKQFKLKELLELYNYNLIEIKTDLAKQYQQSQKNIGSIKPKAKKDFVPTTDPIIEIKNLKKVYKNGKESLIAVNDVSCTFYKKEIVALTGASGSGKSTLLNLIGGLDKPTSGSIVVEGTDIAKMNDKTISNFRNKTIGFVFQFFYMQPFLTLAQNIAVPSMVSNLSRAKRDERVTELVAAVGLSDRLKHLPKELSGGQMQRAAIARALFNTPRIILADEPTGNLDSTNSDSVIELFKKIRDEYDTTIIIVTHDQAVADQADREIIMKDGVIL